MEKVNIIWFRRDLRLHDNAALFKALSSGIKVQPVFIFDKNILNELASDDRRVDHIYQVLQSVQEQLSAYNCSLWALHDHPADAFKTITDTLDVETVYTNHDYEPYAIARDGSINQCLLQRGIGFVSCKDQVIFEKSEIVKDDAKPYTVYTPYNKKWKARLRDDETRGFASEELLTQLAASDEKFPFPSLQQLGFTPSGIQYKAPDIPEKIIQNYHLTRDIPSVHGTSQMSVHLRFGTISIRQLTAVALATNEKYLNELIWRDFYQSLLWHFPHVVNKAFKPAYDNIKWRNDPLEFEAWCTGQTGYPIVDAGMRELNETGWMHNRVRMIVASFLTKHLLIDWRWGEAYFAQKLMDYDLASNNGGWQWASGSGADSAPYFRIFNPYLQTLKFDKELKYIKKWVPEFESFTYPKPVVDHDMARKRCLETYKVALQSESL